MPSLSGSSLAALVRLGALDKHEWDSALQQVLPIACDVVGVDRVSYWSMRHEPASIVCDLGYVREQRLFERGTVLLERAAPRYFRELRSEQLVVRDRLGDDDEPGLGAYRRDRQVHATLDVPVYAQGRLTGVLCLEQVRVRRAWSDRDQELALALGQTFTALLEARARTNAEASERRAAFLAEVSSALAQTLDVTTLGERALGCALPRLGDMGCLVELRSEELRRLAVRHVDPSKQSLLETILDDEPPALPNGPGARAIREHQSLLIPVSDASWLRAYGLPEPYVERVGELGVRSVIAVPLQGRDATLGLLTLGSATRLFDQRDLREAEGFAQLVASHLENARLYALAEDAIRARDEFLSLAAHELRTPLTSLLLAAEVLARDVPATDAGRRAVGTVSRQSRRLARLADLIIEAAQNKLGGARRKTEPIELGALLREVLEDLSLMITRAGCELQLCAGEPIPIRGDRVGLQVVVSTLIDNAAKFGAGQPIEVGLCARDGKAVLTVRDHGIGIDPDRIPRVFTRYERGVPSESFGGLGLGLHVASMIVQAHEGSIAVESQPHGGATFTVTLPLASEP
jgi:signal transduction histidine kinase